MRGEGDVRGRRKGGEGRGGEVEEERREVRGEVERGRKKEDEMGKGGGAIR